MKKKDPIYKITNKIYQLCVCVAGIVFMATLRVCIFFNLPGINWLVQNMAVPGPDVLQWWVSRGQAVKDQRLPLLGTPGHLPPSEGGRGWKAFNQGYSMLKQVGSIANMYSVITTKTVRCRDKAVLEN